ncbi:hypothetical protein B5F78_01345 [Bacteroides sp. An279]|nr:hypothetical protein B5F78_01345 [Bacteroides sp. An279]
MGILDICLQYFFQNAKIESNFAQNLYKYAKNDLSERILSAKSIQIGVRNVYMAVEANRCRFLSVFFI